MILAELAWPEVAALPRDSIIIIPTGAVEQHGPHLPLGTDTLIVEAVANAVEDLGLLTPTIWLGASAHHLAFAGSMSASTDGYRATLTAAFDGFLAHGFRKFAVLNGHGGNSSLNDIVLRDLKAQHRTIELTAIDYWANAAKSIAQILEGSEKALRHACEAETSLMLALHPNLVQMDKASPGALVREPLVLGRIDHFEEISERGSLGYPNLATAEKARAIFAACVETVSNQIVAFSQPTVLRGEPT